MHTIKSLRSVVVLASVCALAACQYGPGPIEQMAIQNMAICNATHDRQACDQWTYEAPLVQGERERLIQQNTDATAGFIAALGAAAAIAPAFAH